MHFVHGALATRVFLCFAYGYLLSFALRSINAVIAPALIDDVGLSKSDLGLLSAVYFLSFAALQLPLGIWLDKYGPRKTEAALLLFAAVGTAIFATSSSLFGLWLGRALIGVGVSSCLMAAFKAYRLWFAPERQSQLASWMLVAGTAGALASTVPVSAALPLIGWRGVFWIITVLLLLSAAAIFFLLKKVEDAFPQQVQQPSASRGGERPAANQGYRHIFSDPYFRRMCILGAVNCATFSALLTLWAGPYMMTVLGMSKPQTAQILFAVNLCLMLTYLSLSWFAPRYVSQDGSHGWPITRAVAVGMSGSVLTQAAILTISAPWTWVLWIVLTFFFTVAILIQTSIGLSFPSALVGRASSAYNLLVFLGAFVMQWGIGLLIDIFEVRGASSSQAMRAAFAVCLACQTVALIAFMMNRAQPNKI
jgi:predicted MFS family arabinose efflux permease